jgi:mRNA-degrading endonuclease YafQ of YafQ-DinJ toxin-antitoxin module
MADVRTKDEFGKEVQKILARCAGDTKQMAAMISLLIEVLVDVRDLFAIYTLQGEEDETTENPVELVGGQEPTQA